MGRVRRFVALIALCIVVLAGPIGSALAGGADDARARTALSTWYRMALELVRHTPTYSPPVASRAFAYLGVTAWEALASGDPKLRSLAGQVNGLAALPTRPVGVAHDDAVVLQAALATVARDLFSHTGPTGQRALAALEGKLAAQAAHGVAPETVERSVAFGRTLAAAILAWAGTDGGGKIETLGFPAEWSLSTEPGRWAPTSRIALQQAPLLPDWGKNRTFAMPAGTTCPVAPPLPYSEEPGSAFFREADEVHRTVAGLSPQQEAIARFWSDDPMLSPTPPGHWIAIADQVLETEDAPAARRAEVMARVGIALADSFIGCWRDKFHYDVIRPVSYIRRLIDPDFEPILNTPPFPEYPSGHSVQSAAAAVVLASIFGDDRPFEDRTHADDGLAPRRFASFSAAAGEAALSRLYGGIHFRGAIENGLAQGRCIGTYAARLDMGLAGLGGTDR